MKGERHPGADAPGLVEVPPHADGRARTETPDRPDLPPRPEEGLDPDNWEALRALGHRMVDDVVAFHRGLSDRPAWQPLPPETRDALRRPPPDAVCGAGRAAVDVTEHMFTDPCGTV